MTSTRCRARRQYPCAQVEQSYALVDMEEQFAAIYAVLRQHMQETPGGLARRLRGASARCLAAGARSLSRGFMEMHAGGCLSQEIQGSLRTQVQLLAERPCRCAGRRPADGSWRRARFCCAAQGTK